MNLLNIIKEAEKKKLALGHFNFATIEQLKAIVDSAIKLKLPVVLGLSEGERDFFGIKQAVAIVKSLRQEFVLPIFLNADHTYSLEKVRQAAEAGFDSIVFDAAGLAFEENIAKTKQAVKIAKRANRKILIEGELGYIGKSSQVLKKIPERAQIKADDLPTVEQAKHFVKETKVDLFAPAVGNFHGILLTRTDVDLTRTNADRTQIDADLTERLYINRIKEIKEAVKVPLVLHGGSGISNEDFVQAIDAGIAMIHISTELRLAWRRGLEQALAQNPDELAPYKLLKDAVYNMEQVVESRLKLFSKIR